MFPYVLWLTQPCVVVPTQQKSEGKLRNNIQR